MSSEPPLRRGAGHSRPARAARADLRTDAMLLTHGRAGTEPLIAAALLIDAVRSGHLDVLEGRRVVAGRTPPTSRRCSPTSATASSPPHPPPRAWIERTAQFAPHRIATELVAAGIAMPLSPRFQRTFTLSVNARAEAAARARIAADPALAVLLYASGLPTGDPLPPVGVLPAARPSARSSPRSAIRPHHHLHDGPTSPPRDSPTAPETLPPQPSGGRVSFSQALQSNSPNGA